jgi:hypothetical protein
LSIPTAFLLGQELIERGRFSGYMFGDYFYNISRDSKVATIPFANFKDPQDLNGFEFRRIYFTYDFQISQDFNTRLRFEIQPFNLVNSIKFVPFVKDAYLQWVNIFNGTNLTFGIQPTPTFDISEYVWENRHLEMTIIDLYGLISSRDFGISLKGKIDKDGMVNYWMLFGNGAGVQPESDRYKTIYANILFKFNSKIWAYANYHHKFLKPIENIFKNGNFLSTDQDLFSLFFSYFEKGLFKFGVEGFANFVKNKIPDTNKIEYHNQNMLGISVFGIYYFTKKYNLVARFDYFDPNIQSDFSDDRRFLYLLGLNYKPVENVSIAPMVMFETFEQKNGINYKPSVTARLVFFYIF